MADTTPGDRDRDRELADQLAAAQALIPGGPSPLRAALAKVELALRGSSLDAAAETEAVERVLVGELSMAFEAGRRWLPGGAAFDTQHHARRIAARLAASPPAQGPAETEAGDASLVSCAGHVPTWVREGDADDQPCPWCAVDEATAAMDRANSRLGALYVATPPAPEGEAVYREPSSGELRPRRVWWSPSMAAPSRSGLYVELIGRGGLLAEVGGALVTARTLPDDAVDLVPGVRLPAPAGPQAEGAGGDGS